MILRVSCNVCAKTKDYLDLPPFYQDNISEMLAQKVDPDYEDPYEDVSSAKSLSSSSHTSPFNETDSRDNILQLLEAGYFSFPSSFSFSFSFSFSKFSFFFSFPSSFSFSYSFSFS